MAESQSQHTVGPARDGEQQAPAADRKPSHKTLQELERLQFDALDRAAFDKR